MSILRIIGSVVPVSGAILVATSCTSAASFERDAWRHHRPLPYNGADRSDAASSQNPAPLVIDGVIQASGVIRLAELNSPQLMAAYKRWQAAVSDITASTAFPDAVLSYTQLLNSAEWSLGLDQQIPNPGKLAARENMAAGEARAMRANFSATMLALRESVQVAIADIQELDANIGVMEKVVDIIRSFESVIEARVSAGAIAQAELLRVQVERERIASDLASLRLRRPSLLEALNALTGSDLPADLPFQPMSHDNPVPLPPEDILATLISGHPALEEDLARVAVAQAEKSGAGWSWVPDFSVGLEYRRMEERDAFALKAGITIPWQIHANKARGDAARAREEAAQYAMQQTKLNLEARLKQAIYVREDATRLIRLYNETVIPKARQTLELSQTRFSAGEASLTDILDAERALLASELSFINAGAQRLRGEAQIEALIARQLGAIGR